MLSGKNLKPVALAPHPQLLMDLLIMDVHVLLSPECGQGSEEPVPGRGSVSVFW